MSPNLDALLNGCRDFASHVLIHDQRELGPLFHIISGSGDNIVIVPAFDDEDAKAASLVAIQDKMREVDAVAYCSIAEAWMVRRHEREGVRCAPSESEDRIEIVMCFACTRDDRKALLLEIVRDDKGKVVALKEDDDSATAGLMGGRVASLFDGMGA